MNYSVLTIYSLGGGVLAPKRPSLTSRTPKRAVQVQNAESLIK